MFNPKAPRKGRLIIDLELIDESELPEEAHKIDLTEGESVHSMLGATVSLSIECGDLCVHDLETVHPADYLANGPIAALISELAHGLSDDDSDGGFVKAGERMANKVMLAKKAMDVMEALDLDTADLKKMQEMLQAGASRTEIFSEVVTESHKLETMETEGNA